MNKSDYIEYWRLTAGKDWEAAGHLFEKGDYLHSLFFAHLVLEKLLKAHFVKTMPPIFHPKPTTCFCWFPKPQSPRQMTSCGY